VAILQCLIVMNLLYIGLPSYRINETYLQNKSSNEYLITRGKALINEGKYEQAVNCLREYIRLSNPNKQKTLECYMSLGSTFVLINKFKESADCYGQAKALARKLEQIKIVKECNVALEIHDWIFQAIEIRKKGNILLSNRYFEEAYKRAQELDSDAHKLGILSHWYLNYLREMKSDKYINLSAEALALAEKLKNKKEERNILNNVGTYYLYKEEYSNALPYLFKALQIARELGDIRSSSLLLCNLASHYLNLGDFRKSFEYGTEALQVASSNPDNQRLAILFNNLGEAYKRIYLSEKNDVDLKRTIDCYETSIKYAEKVNDPEILNLNKSNLGAFYGEVGQFDKALSLLLPVVGLAKKADSSLLYGMILNQLGLIAFKRGHNKEAEYYFRDALSIAYKTNTNILLMRSNFGVGLCMERIGMLEPALEYFDESNKNADKASLKTVGDVDRANIAQNKIEIYDRLISIHYELYKKKKLNTSKKELFYLAEKAKMGSFIDFMNRMKKVTKKSNDDKEMDELKSLRLSYLKKIYFENPESYKYDRLEAVIQQIDDQINTKVFEKYRKADYKEIIAAPTTINVLQKYLLKNGAILLEYFLGDKRSYLFFISSDAFEVVELPPNAAIENSISGYLRFLENPSFSPLRGMPAAKRIYEELLLPVEKYMSKSPDHIIIIPDGILYDLPFETLASTNSTKPKYLVERYSISYSPSSSFLMMLDQKPRDSKYFKDFLGIASSTNSLLRGNNKVTATSRANLLLDLYAKKGFIFDLLPYGRKEILEISKKFHDGKKDILLGDKAKEGTLKSLDMSRYRIIHFSCHAYSDENNPLQSTLMLSLKEDKEDGFFQVREMYEMKINSELVVLSACQTAKGRNIRNEGVLGLPRVFFYMGSRAVISSLWCINDKTTAQFMKYFYSYIAKNKDKSQALRQAKLDMIRSKYSHPYYWGAFLLTGEL